MSAETPTRSSPSPDTPANSSTSDPAQNASSTERAVLAYLRSRGFSAAEQSLLQDIDRSTTPDDKGKRPVSSEDLLKNIAVFAQSPSKPGVNVLNDNATVLHGLKDSGSPPNIQNLIASIGSVGAEEILCLDPTDKQGGFRELEAWVDGSLDMYRVRPIICLCRFQV
jgi:transcription initiation factor TFIID subunit 5